MESRWRFKSDDGSLFFDILTVVGSVVGIVVGEISPLILGVHDL